MEQQYQHTSVPTEGILSFCLRHFAAAPPPLRPFSFSTVYSLLLPPSKLLFLTTVTLLLPLFVLFILYSPMTRCILFPCPSRATPRIKHICAFGRFPADGSHRQTCNYTHSSTVTDTYTNHSKWLPTECRPADYWLQQKWVTAVHENIMHAIHIHIALWSCRRETRVHLWYAACWKWKSVLWMHTSPPLRVCSFIFTYQWIN